MAVVLRLKRFGSKKMPFYRIVAMDKANKRDGKPLEEVGSYDPKKGEENAVLKKDRIKYWLENGAQPSQTVKSLIKKAG
ncbi:MAG: 30S ribosomal protein S16 [Candidatus Omnitrophica bacterium]|nr:30S ribosomal protein S16 [Candidatus Omnitrophota bacterium]